MPTGATLPALDEPNAGRLNIQYGPHADTVITENPPRFSWLPMIEAESFTGLPLNFFTPDTTLPAGDYHWSYAVWSPSEKAPSSTWSVTRSFTIADGLPETPLASRDTRYASAEMAHPRLWLSPDLLTQFKKDLAKDPSHCTWDVFFEKSVAPWMERDLITFGARLILRAKNCSTRSGICPWARRSPMTPKCATARKSG